MATDDTRVPDTGVPAAAPATPPTKDMSAYFRTYAKDMAQASGAPALAAPSPAPVAPAPAEKPAVVLPEPEEPFFERPSVETQKLYEKPEVIPSRADLDSVIERAPQPVAAPQPAPSREAMMPQSPVASPLPATDAPDEDRAQILERLRQKVSARGDMIVVGNPTPARPEPFQNASDTAPMPPAPPADTVAPITPWPRVAPTDAAPPKAPAPVPAPTPAPVRKEKPAKKDTFSPEPFHSFTTDFDDRLKNTGGSRLSVIAAEQDARATAPRRAAPKARVHVAPILAGIMLVLLGGGGAYAAYQYLGTHQAVPIVAPSVPSLVFADEYQELAGGEGANAQAELAKAAAGTLVADTVLVTYVKQSSTSEKGALLTSVAPGSVLANAVLGAAPDILRRNIADASTVGVIHVGEETRAFFALRVTSYERTFAGMLTWEPLMLRDLALLYPLYPVVEPAPLPVLDTGTTTASSTPAAPAAVEEAPVATGIAQARTRFEDAVIANHDVRVIRDTAGRALLLYGFADKETLIIARDEAAFTMLLSRLAAASR